MLIGGATFLHSVGFANPTLCKNGVLSVK